MSYINAREAWLNTQCHADSTVARGLLKKGADWGREYETLANVDRFANALEGRAYESPAVTEMQTNRIESLTEVKLVRTLKRFLNSAVLKEVPMLWYSESYSDLKEAMRAYDAERAGSGEK